MSCKKRSCQPLVKCLGDPQSDRIYIYIELIQNSDVQPMDFILAIIPGSNSQLTLFCGKPRGEKKLSRRVSQPMKLPGNGAILVLPHLLSGGPSEAEARRLLMELMGIFQKGIQILMNPRLLLRGSFKDVYFDSDPSFHI